MAHLYVMYYGIPTEVTQITLVLPQRIRYGARLQQASGRGRDSFGEVQATSRYMLVSGLLARNSPEWARNWKLTGSSPQNMPRR